jgi:hypothetical protein
MLRSKRVGFSLLETVVALTLFAGVVLSMIGTGQLVLARMYENDLRFRSTSYAQSLLDSLRGTACARLTSGSANRGSLAASWSVTDIRDLVRIDVAVSVPQRRGAAATSKNTMTLVWCPEP